MRYIFLFICVFLLFNLQAQRNQNNTAINVSTAINYNPASRPYFLQRNFQYNGDNIELTYLTENSGTFIEEDLGISVEEQNTINTLSHLLGLSTSVQFVKSSGLFHELTLTSLSYAKAQHVSAYTLRDSLDEVITTFDRFTEVRHFIIGGRYEVGRYLGRDAPVRIGFSGGISYNYQKYSFLPSLGAGSPITGSISILNLVIAPMMLVKFSDKVFAELKILPNMLLANFDRVILDSPILLEREKLFELDYDPPSFQVGASLMLKYQIKTPRRRRR